MHQGRGGPGSRKHDKSGHAAKSQHFGLHARLDADLLLQNRNSATTDDAGLQADRESANTRRVVTNMLADTRELPPSAGRLACYAGRFFGPQPLGDVIDAERLF
jgi:hypothetical protein